MAYWRCVPYQLTDEQVAGIVDVSRQVDLKAGPGGARITPVWGPLRDTLRSALADVSLVRWVSGGSMDLQLESPILQLVALYPSRQIPAHSDPPIAGKRRYHIPIETNDGCWVFHGGEWAQLQVGHWYEMDPTVIHGAVNWGSTVRVHLMVDTA